MNPVKPSETRNHALQTVLDETGFRLRVHYTDYNEDYVASPDTRATTNYANLARHANRKANLKQLFLTINQRLNALMPLCGHAHGSYQIRLRIVSVQASFANHAIIALPLSEMLEATVVNQTTNECLQGALGMNFSSYVRDHDFNVLYPKIRQGQATDAQKRDFGLLHGLLYKLQFKDFWDGGVIEQATITAISVSSRKRYQRLPTPHPILGHPYTELPDSSPTTRYFRQMGMDSVFYMPPGCMAPLAIYLQDGDISRFSAIELASLIAVMDTFERIYRPEIYNLSQPVGEHFEPSLSNTEYLPLDIIYDRDERESLAMQQASRIESEFLTPYAPQLQALVDAYRSSIVHAPSERESRR